MYHIFNKSCGTCSMTLLVLVMLLFSVGCQDRKSLPDMPRLEIDTRDTQPLRQALYGFNTNMITGDYGYLDPDFVELTRVLAPKTLRFPGGTVGNFYHWEVGGFFENEMASTLNLKLNQRNRGNYVKLQRRRNGKILFDDFMQLCDTLKITPVIVVNLWTGSPEESAAWVRYAEDKGYGVKHWELGNEYYLPHYLNKYPTAGAYIKEAKKHAAAMKVVNPNIKVSVCATPVGFHKEGWLVKTQQRKWDEDLAADTGFSMLTPFMFMPTKPSGKKRLRRCEAISWGGFTLRFQRHLSTMKNYFPVRRCG